MNLSLARPKAVAGPSSANAPTADAPADAADGTEPEVAAAVAAPAAALAAAPAPAHTPGLALDALGGYRSCRVYWVIVIRSSNTLDPKTIAKQAFVSKYAASDTSEGAQLFTQS